MKKTDKVGAVLEINNKNNSI